MSLPITDRLNAATQSQIVQPQIVFEIDGIDQVFGIDTIKVFTKIGNNITIGDFIIGGYTLEESQKQYVSLNGTTTSIKQTLEIDKGRGGSISTFQVSLIDFNNEISTLISPGLTPGVDDILGRKCKVYLGVVKNTSFPDDYIIIFRGIIDEIITGPGIINFNLSHPDKKKQQTIFPKAESKLNGAINSSTTTIVLDSTTNFLSQVNGPSGYPDPAITNYILIEDELIKYTTYTGNSLNGVVRGQLGTTAASHSDDADVISFYRLTDTAINLALKIMLSGKNDYFIEDISMTHFGNNGVATTPNVMWFQEKDLESLYNIQLGDYLTTSGASNGANNFTLKEIIGIDVDDETNSTILTIGGVTLIEELNSTAIVNFRSQFDTLGTGLMMDPEEVDITEHISLRDRYLSDFDYDFYIKDDIENAKEFLEQEIYLPAAAYSLPRKSQSSMGIFTPPIPGADIAIIDKTNILNPNSIKLRRSINKDFYNTIIYKFEEQVLEEKFIRGVITIDATSKLRIPIGTKSFNVTSKGIRENLNGITLSTRSINRKLNIYKYAAESADGIKVQFGDGFKVEVGDIIIFDPTDLSVTDLVTGNRTKGADLFFVKNRTIDLKTGIVTLDIVDTGFSTTSRYGLISPASKVLSATSTVIEITASFSQRYGSNEGKKWKRWIGEILRIRSPDFTNNDTSVLQSVVGNILTLSPALSFTPSADDIVEFSHYNDMSSTVHSIYAFMADSAFDDSSLQYNII